MKKIFTWSFLQATADTECCSTGAGAGLGGVAVSMLQVGGVAAAVRTCHHCRCPEGGETTSFCTASVEIRLLYNPQQQLRSDIFSSRFDIFSRCAPFTYLCWMALLVPGPRIKYTPHCQASSCV